MDQRGSVLANKAREWIENDDPQNHIEEQPKSPRPRRVPSIKRKIRPSQPKKKPANNKPERASSQSTASSDSSRSTSRPVYRQYIFDRVSGNSYVPRHARKGKYLVRKASAQSDETGDGASSDGIVENEEEEEDPTDCGNRPPHFLCYLPPCVRRCPGFFEQNRVCEWAGKIGIHGYFKNHHLARRRIFTIGFLFNLAALCLTIVTAMAFSKDYAILTSTSFSRGTVWVPQWSNDTKATINIGIRAVALDDPGRILGGKGDSVSTFNNFCEDAVVGDIESFLSNDLCGDCRASSHRFVLSTLINIILILRNLFSDITRMYPKYDLNCPNFYGSLMATLSVFLGLWTIVTYQNRCFRIVHEDTRPFYVPNNFTGAGGGFANPDEALLRVEFDWKNGPGLDCLIVATLLRFVDAICNYIVPTPSITRTYEEQESYELEFGDKSQTPLTMRKSEDSEGSGSRLSPARPVSDMPTQARTLQISERSVFSSSDEEYEDEYPDEEEVMENSEQETTHHPDEHFFL